MDVSLIIVNYNTKDLILDCLRSIYEFTKDLQYEVIVVDNNSSDDSVNCIRDCYPKVKLIVNKENYGFGKANNIGASYALGKYLFLLNSDCILLNNAVKIFFEYAEKSSPLIGAFGTLLLSEEKEITISYGSFITIRNVLHNHFMDYVHKMNIKVNHDKKDSTPPFDVDYITGADLFIRKDITDKIGLFDERFFMYSEENELQYRMHLNGYRRVIIDGPLIIHLESRSTSLKINREIMRYDSLFKFIKKYNNPLKYYFFRVAMFLFLCPKVLYMNYTKPEKKRFLKFLFK